MGKYMPRLFFEHFNRNVRKTYTYELIDQKPDPEGLEREENFGLLRNDGTEKPAYKTLKNLIDLLEDPGPKFKPGSLDYSLGGNIEDVHRTLLQKRDGKFYLVLWKEVSSYDREAKKDVSVKKQEVALTLNRPISKAATYLPNQSNTPVRQYASSRKLTLQVPDYPLVVELTPSGGAPKVTNLRPKILNIKPRSNARIKDRTPGIRAKVTDDSNLSKRNIKFFFDGKKKNFSYSRSRDRLKYNSRKKLKVGSRHRVKIIVRDAKGLRKAKTWRFKVVRRK